MFKHALLAAFALAGGLLAVAPATALETGDVFGKWAVKCGDQQDEDAARAYTRCHIYQNLVQKEERQRVLRVSVGYARETGKPVMILDLPLGVWLPPGVTVKVDGSEAIRIPIQICLAGGCRATYAIGDDLRSRLQAGEKIQVTVYSVAQEAVTIPVSLDGYAAAFHALSEQ